MKARSDEALLHAIAIIVKRSIAAGTCSWSTNHLQLVRRASMRQYTIIGYVQNGYYPVMKCSFRILCKMRG